MRGPGAGLAAGLALLVCASGARAHVVYGTKTLHGLVAEADLVMRARIAAVDELRDAAPEAPGESRPTVVAEVLEVVKGSFEAPRIRFAQHGHGVLEFRPGSETLVFLIGIERSRELDALGAEGSLAWVSLQEHEDDYRLEAPTRERLLAVVRTYAAAGSAASAAERESALRQATLALLTSGDARLASSALRDLVLAPGATLVSAEDRPALLTVLGDPRVAIGVRVALLAELERRGIVEGPAQWLALLAPDAPPRERAVAVRAAGASASPPVRARVVELVADPEVEVASAAAIALGWPGNREAVAALAGALAREAPGVRMAAIRALGRIGTPEAERALEATAASHPDPATRRRAEAELRKRRPSRGT